MWTMFVVRVVLLRLPGGFSINIEQIHDTKQSFISLHKFVFIWKQIHDTKQIGGGRGIMNHES